MGCIMAKNSFSAEITFKLVLQIKRYVISEQIGITSQN